MNQILDYNPNKSSSGGSSKSDKIVRVFAIFLALFAVCLLGVGGYSYISNKGKTEVANTPGNATEPVIEVEEQENALIIKVSHDKAIKEMVYNWNDEKESRKTYNGETEIETQINLLAGENTLNIIVTDIDGVEAKYSNTYVSDVGEDKEKPVIDTEVNGNKLIITATDETEMDFVTYRWNNDVEQKVEVEAAGQKTIQFEIEILKGKNDLMIVAVDKNNNSESKEANYTGVTKPDINITVSAEKDHVDIYIAHETGIKEVLLQINGVDQTVDLGPEVRTSANIGFEISGQKNTIKVVAISLDNTKTEAEEEIVNENFAVDDVEITIERSLENPKQANISFNSREGTKTIRLNLNDMDIPINLPDDVDPALITTGSFPIDLANGNNRITVTIVKPNDIEKTETKEIYVEE